MTQINSTEREQLRATAAQWFALMRGPDAAERRPQFEAWLAADPIHRDAYNRIGETFALGKTLKRIGADSAKASAPASSGMASGHSSRRRLRKALVEALVLLGLLASTVTIMRVVSGEGFLQPASPTMESRQFATARGEVRTVTLPDGSRLTLDTESRVTASYSSSGRHFTMGQGRVRFHVAHEKRPFEVLAGGGVVIARGTVFDVTVDPQHHAVVDLIQGRIDVRAQAKGSPPSVLDRSAVRHLEAGQSLSLGQVHSPPAIVSSLEVNWPDDLRDFKSVRVIDLVDDANRYTEIPIRLASRDIGELRVSGTLTVRDSRKLASNLSALLDLEARQENGSIVLAHR